MNGENLTDRSFIFADILSKLLVKTPWRRVNSRKFYRVHRIALGQ